jgi:hypothetical protein
MPRLRIKIPGQNTETHAVSAGRVTIGRRPDNTIQILDRSVSAYHAELVAVNGHYRLRDLQSTNLCFVEGKAVSEYHLRERCKLVFGAVECEFDPTPDAEERSPKLSPEQMEQEVTFLRTENAELREKNRGLQRRIDILSSAQLFGEKRGLDRKPANREEPATRVAMIQAELERTREELAIALRARDAAREAAGLIQAEKTTMLQEIRASGIQRVPVPLK